MIVDCHAHLLPAWRMGKLLKWTQAFNPGHPIPQDVTLAALLDEYRAAGVDRVWNPRRGRGPRVEPRPRHLPRRV
jgi:hypothetical protein